MFCILYSTDDIIFHRHLAYDDQIDLSMMYMMCGMCSCDVQCHMYVGLCMDVYLCGCIVYHPLSASAVQFVEDAETLCGSDRK